MLKLDEIEAANSFLMLPIARNCLKWLVMSPFLAYFLHIFHGIFGIFPYIIVLLLLKRTYQGRNIWDDPIIEKSQDQDQGQGQGQDHPLPQRAALPQFLVLALTLTLVLILRFFNYRVVPDIPSLINSLYIRYQKSTF